MVSWLTLVRRWLLPALLLGGLGWGAHAQTQCTVPASGTYTGKGGSGGVWGNNASGYTSDSDIGRAAVHAGLLTAGAAGTITITSLGQLASFSGTTANGVTTSSWGTFCGMRLSGGTATASAPTITVQRNPSPMVAGQAFTLSWSTTNATSVSYSCTASGTGFSGNSGALAVNGSSSGTAQAGWVGNPSSCTWTATGPGGTRTFTESMTTNAATGGGVSAACLAVTPASGTYTGATAGNVWGNNSSGYSTDSVVGVAAVHAGLLSAGASGSIVITPLDQRTNFTGTTANGVTTKSFANAWCAMRLSAGSTLPTPAPTITIQRNPSPMIAGQAFTNGWATTNATSVSYSCTASGTGFKGNSGTLAANGNSGGTALSAWVGNPSTCVWTATGPGGSKSFTETMTTNAAPVQTPAPTISVQRNPSPMTAGQAFTNGWTTTNATSVSYSCTASGTGFKGNSGTLAANGTSGGTALAAWVGNPSTCVWTAVGSGGSKTFTETMTTVSGATDTVTYFHNDVSGSPMLATDQNGNVLWKENYRPYGEKLNNQAASTDNKIGFHGQQFDNNSGLSYMKARYYDPVLGRFMGIDPVGYDTGNLHSFNRYAYANNNPYKFVDPDGRNALRVLFQFLSSIVRAAAISQAKKASDKMKDSMKQESAKQEGNKNDQPNGAEKPKNESAKSDKKENSFPDRKLPRDKSGNPMPDPEAEGAHSQLGQKEGRNGKYDQAREFDETGKPVRDIDFTDHGRPQNHTNPHQHRYVPNPTGGTPMHGPAEPLS